MEIRDRVAEVKELWRQGLPWDEIWKKIGMARTYANGKTSVNKRKPDSKNAAYICRIRRPNRIQTCQRGIGHEGIHLSDEEGKLLWW